VLCGEKDQRTHEFLLEQAHPSAELVRKVYETLRRATSAQLGRSEAVARSVGSGCSAAQVDAALRVLLRLGVLRANTKRTGEPYIRFVATDRMILARADGSAALPVLNRLLMLHTAAGLYRGVSFGWRSVQGSATIDQLLTDFGSLASAGLIEWRPSRDERTIEWLRTARSDDWADIQHQRDREQRRLDSMRGYTSTESCRRAFLLGYFGEESTDLVCPGCDNCRQRSAPTPPMWRRWASRWSLSTPSSRR
jgi:ATP-dependent DNA helicase RecQ